MEGTTSVPAQETSSTEFYKVDTTNILFICGGAFAGLDKLIDNESSIGFKDKVKL